jgi:ABC-type transport system substrate-binding protein
MLLAIDQVAVGDALYEGEYELIGCPIGALPELQDAFMSLDELPENIQEMYGLDVDKAKALLTEAGYPDGFQASVVCYSPQVDALAIVADFWSKVGIELTLDVKEYGVYSDISSALTHEDMFMSSCEGTIPHKFVNYTYGNTINKAMVDDPTINAAKTEVTAAYWDYAERMRLLKEVNAYIQEQALGYATPEGYQYFFWWPWVKGFSGEYSVGYYDGLNFPLWIWVDQDLKKEMGY